MGVVPSAGSWCHGPFKDNWLSSSQKPSPATSFLSRCGDSWTLPHSRQDVDCLRPVHGLCRQPQLLWSGQAQKTMFQSGFPQPLALTIVPSPLLWWPMSSEERSMTKTDIYFLRFDSYKSLCWPVSTAQRCFSDEVSELHLSGEERHRFSGHLNTVSAQRNHGHSSPLEPMSSTVMVFSPIE